MIRVARRRASAGRAMRIALATTGLFLTGAVAEAQLFGCSINTASGVSFGNYDALEATPLDQTGSITFQCGVLYVGTVTVDLSRGNSGTYAYREMRKGVHSLRYNLYLDAARSQIWGNGTQGSSRYGPVLPLLGSPRTLTIFGRIPAQQASPVGVYSETIVATINF